MQSVRTRLQLLRCTASLSFLIQYRSPTDGKTASRVSGDWYIKFRGACWRDSIKQTRQTGMDYTFRDSEFMTAREKQLALKGWVRFLKRGLRFEDFTDRLYKHLHLHCSFHAHYNRAGFYQTYFENGVDAVRFLSQFDRKDGRSLEYGGTWWLEGEYGDVNRAMVEEGAKYLPELMKKALLAQREADLALARRLLAKHGHQPPD